VIYIDSIIALQSLLRGIINPNNDVAIVVSTLVIAALFQPLRHRLQAIIDRRFYRRKYDAARTLVAFSAILRNEVDLRRVSFCHGRERSRLEAYPFQVDESVTRALMLPYHGGRLL
jgi:hypothetical protein